MRPITCLTTYRASSLLRRTRRLEAEYRVLLAKYRAAGVKRG